LLLEAEELAKPQRLSLALVRSAAVGLLAFFSHKYRLRLKLCT
jgi:hypothetical protein